MVLRRGRFLRSLHSDSLGRSPLHVTDALFFSLQGFIFNHVFGIDVLLSCVFIYEFFVYTAKQSIVISSIFKLYPSNKARIIVSLQQLNATCSIKNIKERSFNSSLQGNCLKYVCAV